MYIYICVCVCVCVCVFVCVCCVCVFVCVCCVCVYVQTAEKVWLSCFVTVESRSDLRMNLAFLDNERLRSGFGGLGVACWPLVPKFAGSNTAETVGFLGRKDPQHAFRRRGSKAVGPMS